MRNNHACPNNTSIVKPPWNLRGEGWISMYWLDKSKKQLFSINSNLPSNPALLMMVNYHDSPIGPYHELLLIPGKYNLDKRSGYSITHIHVSTDVSTFNGRENWQIPKQTSKFLFDKKESNISFDIIDSHKKTTKLSYSNRSVSLPVFTHLIPYNILQKKLEKCVQFRPEATGKAVLATLTNFHSNMAGFEALNHLKPIISLYIPSFKMTFPIARWC